MTFAVDLASCCERRIIWLSRYVLDTEFGPRCDVTNLLVLTRSQQEVSARKFVAAMISLPRLHTSRSSQVISAFASIAFVDYGTPVRFMVVGRAETANSCRTASHCLGPGGFLHFGVNVQNANVVSDGKRGRQRSAPNCAQMCWNRRSLQCHRTKLVHPETSPSRSQTHSSRDHTRFAP